VRRGLTLTPRSLILSQRPQRLVVMPRHGAQSKRSSLVESLVRASFNFCTALAIQITLFPAIFHKTLPISQNFGIGFIFMANSIVGGYIIRRCFNKLR
jgi:hypothetical protein